MHFEKIHNKGQARLFKSDLLESLTKTRPWVIYSIYLPFNAWLLYYSHTKLAFSVPFIAGLFFAALLSWTLFEYFAHRYLFHYEAKSKIGQRLVYIFHGNHHEYPRDRMRLFMPPVPSIILAAVVFGLIYAVSFISTGTGSYACIFFPGFITGYLAYVSMHYAIHAYAPPKPLKAIWRNHHLHHYKYPEKGFGVSSTFWDIIFRTVPRNDDEENKSNESSGYKPGRFSNTTNTLRS
ncbi:sterol desaturase family protein [Arcticibacter sp. MXS-1]|uniref:sterol desaturase family protein n=1 Tax=Arcticibacter sp. MXS-1 TaxID=3341726 RepID=UPI0035A8E9EC